MNKTKIPNLIVGFVIGITVIIVAIIYLFVK